MINTILYKKENLLCCHTVGILNCKRIVDTKIDTNTYLYTVIYENGEEVEVDNVILATDLKLV